MIIKLLLLLACRLLVLYEFVLLARCIASFFVNGYSRGYVVLCQLTDWTLFPIRRLLEKTPLSSTRLDFSPMIAFFVIGVLERCLILLSRIF